MAYKITIEKTEEVTEIDNGDWTVIDKRPYNEEELDEMLGGQRPKFEGELKEIRGYTPKREITRTRTKQVYEQIVDDMNITDVIQVVNGVKP